MREFLAIRIMEPMPDQNPRPLHALQQALTKQALGAWLGVVCCVGPAYAVGVGAIKGQAVVGRTLDVSVPIQADDAADAISATCVQHSVYFGDGKVEARRATGAWVDRQAKGEGVYRITTSGVVNEPVVSVEVRAGCAQAVTRRFELLADAPAAAPAPEAVVVPRVSSAASVVPTKKAVEGSALPDAPPVSLASDGASSPAAKLAQRSGRASGAPANTKAPAAMARRSSGVVIEAVTPDGVAAHSDEGGKLPPVMDIRPLAANESLSRLKVDTLSEWASGLKTTPLLTTSPATNDQARQEAQALWRSLNGGEVGDAKRVQALETELKAIKADGKKQQLAQDALRSELDRAQQAQYVNPVVGGLAALLLCALAVLGYQYMRRRHPADSHSKWWYSKDSLEDVMEGVAIPAEDTSKTTRPKSKLRSRAGTLPKPSPTVPAPRLNPRPSGFQPSAPVSIQPPGASAFPASASGARSRFMQSMMGSRAVSVDELFDIQQQAEFFVSLGQHDQAIELLRHHIFAATGTSGLAYLDLLHIYHQLGRKDDYEELRQEFNRDFRANVPAFDNYSQQGRGIERYAPLISRIVEAWGTHVVLEEIEQLIFRKPSPGAHQDEEAFDLNAYRELMLLYAIAKDVLGESGEGVTAQPLSEQRPAPQANKSPLVAGDARAPQPSSFPPVQIDLGEPLVAVGGAHGAGTASAFGALPTQVNTAVGLPKEAHNVGLDVDLSALEAWSSATPPAVEPPSVSRPDVDFDELGIFADNKPASTLPDLHLDEVTLDIPQKPAKPVLETPPGLVPRSRAPDSNIDLDVNISDLFAPSPGHLMPLDSPADTPRTTKQP